MANINRNFPPFIVTAEITDRLPYLVFWYVQDLCDFNVDHLFGDQPSVSPFVF